MNGDTIIVPSFRKDLELKADIAEEIAEFPVMIKFLPLLSEELHKVP